MPDPSINKVCAGTPPAFLIGGYGKDLSNLSKFQTRNITVGVAIQLPFRNTTAKANFAGARIQREQLDASVRSTEQLVEVDVRNAAQAVETARMRVLAARSARQNALANARDQEVRAETDYTKAVSSLQHATSTTLHANNIVVENPVKP